ncbi:regulation of nuclear pre-mRNA domain-containing protein 1B-like [Pollicipes pollicipes]|uniref:regulation of nuclear pre-mRNA domain-containing protein 1B-like n=1 Tax=Pollicipes pollicipes TaxID=41117 RepID=UPI001884A5F1|nr:regulation of nuclear pre-mRNA domain-containing protein 1B-like [Pollicipes pollicipes]
MGDLENSASADAATREKISGLPPEVSDTAMLARLQDRGSGHRLLTQVSEALDLLTDYNSRLASEMDERKRVSRLLQDFTQSQKDLLAQAEHTLEEYRHKLEKVYLVREELKSHIQNLPDISKLPNVTGAFAPLPSAGDLFS